MSRRPAAGKKVTSDLEERRSHQEERRYTEPRMLPVATGKRARSRSAGERDRDRILYSSAFQRLAGITQVVSAPAGQAVHSRLTHSLKVAQVARRLAQRMVEHEPELAVELDPDSVEAAALVHDLGHPPFGHISEEVLRQFADDHHTDGFEGNAQSFRIVTRLAQRWPGDDSDERKDWGLNLTRRTLNGMLKYPWPRDIHDPKKKHKWGAYALDSDAFGWARRGSEKDEPSLAAQIMDWADDLTYAIHDMEDFYRAGLIPLDRLCTSVRERDRFVESFSTDGNPRLQKFQPEELADVVENLFDWLDFVDPYTGTREQRQVLRERTSFMIRLYMHAMYLDKGKLKIDPRQRAEVAVLKELAWCYVINRSDLATVQEGQRIMIKEICECFWSAVNKKEMHLFPPLEQQAIRDSLQIDDNEAVKARIVCDFVGRLTEGRALDLHHRLLGTSVAPVIAPSPH